MKYLSHCAVLSGACLRNKMYEIYKNNNHEAFHQQYNNLGENIENRGSNVNILKLAPNLLH